MGQARAVEVPGTGFKEVPSAGSSGHRADSRDILEAIRSASCSLLFVRPHHSVGSLSVSLVLIIEAPVASAF